MSEPRAHHFVPRFYLSGFSTTTEKNGRLWVIDSLKGKAYLSSPKNVGRERDYYRLEGENHGAFESFLSKIESESARVFREMKTNESLPKGEDFEMLLFFVALSYFRVPRFRNTYFNFLESINKKLALNIAQYSKDYQTKLSEALSVNGASLPPEKVGEYTKLLFDSGRLKIHIPVNEHARVTLETLEFLCKLLKTRKWYLFVTDNKDQKFVTTDAPMSIHLTTDDPRPAWSGISFVEPDSRVIFPINKHMVLVGEYKGPGGHTIKAPSNVVSLLNTVIINSATNYVYAPSNEISWTFENEERSFGDLIAYLVQKQGGRA